MRIAVVYAGMQLGRFTDALTNTVVEGMRLSLDEYGDEYEIIRYNLRDMKINPCTGCLACNLNGECIIKDDMQILYEEFDLADIIIFASPVFFNSITSTGKAVVDRCQIYWSRKVKLGSYRTKKRKSGVMLLASGSSLKPAETEASRQILKIFFLASDTRFDKETILGNTDKIGLDKRIDELKLIKDEYRKYMDGLIKGRKTHE